MQTILEAVKLSMRPAIKTSAYDEDILELIEAAKLDLLSNGIIGSENDPLIRQAIKTYCRLHFGTPDDADRLQSAYDAQKGHLQMSSDYTDWGDDDAG